MGDIEKDTAATISPQQVTVDCINPGFQVDDGDDPTQDQPKSAQNGNVRYNPASPCVAISQPGVPVIAEKPDPSRKPKDFVIFSCFIIFACNFIFGLFAYNFGVKSSWAWQLGEESQAKKKSKWALIFCIIGFIVGVATWVLVFTLYFTIGRTPHDVTNP